MWARVTNGDQTATHLVIIDPPPRTYTVNPELRVTEGDEATVTVNLGSPATSGGVTFDVTTAYNVGGATNDDIGEIVSTVTVPEGQRSVSIAVPTVEDYFVEDDESFTVSVSHVGSPVWAKDPEGADTTTLTIVNDDEPVALPPGPEPHNISVTPGDGTLTVTWDVSERDGHDNSEIWHVLRWYQPDGEAHRWHNPRDPRAVGANDGLSVDPGVNSYTIDGLTNGVAADLFVRSMVGHRNNMSEQHGDSSKWVKLNGIHTTPIAADAGAPTLKHAVHRLRQPHTRNQTRRLTDRRVHRPQRRHTHHRSHLIKHRRRHRQRATRPRHRLRHRHSRHRHNLRHRHHHHHRL